MRRSRRSFLALMSVASTRAAEKRVFRDPAPPEPLIVPAMEPVPAKPNPDIKFHGKPKPLPPGAVTHDWKSFLGPTHNAISTETRLLHDWPRGGPKMVWEMRKGTSFTSPAIAGERLVYFHRTASEERVECLHPENGSRYWQFSYGTRFEDRYGYNNGPRSSPVIDEDRVFTVGAEGKLHCLKLSTGQVLWKRDLAADFKVPQDFFGTASTPLIDGGNLIVTVGAPGGPTVASFNKTNGKLVWGAGDQWGPSYSSPVPATVHGKPRVFALAGGESRPPTGGLLSIDPRDGALDFSFPWRSASYESVNASCPVIAGNQAFVSASYKAGGALLNLGPDGSHTVAWTTQEFGLHWNTAVHKDGYLYGFDGRNEPDASLACIELKTGKIMWRETPEWEETLNMGGVPRAQRLGTFRGSLLHVDGRFLCLGELGHLMWLDLTPKGYKELSRTWLFPARETWALPVLSRGLLYISQNSAGLFQREPPRLICYDFRAAK
ncbi:MAG: hypothetical protein EXQ52_06935 [Bryobacterales bacterium]|nr:hypothetical protein [Bryobacterales bacterium]